MARVSEVLEPERHRILAEPRGELVDELLGAEVNLRAYRIAHVRGAQRRAALHQLRDRFPGKELVLETVRLRGDAENLRRLGRDAGELPDQAVRGVRLVGGDVLARKTLGDE